MVRIIPPVWAAIAAGSQLLLTRGRGSTRGSRILAAPVLIASGAFGLVAVGGFRRAGTTIDPEHPDRARHLVTTGVNAWTRNPMYLAITGALVAVAIVRRSVLALVPVVGFVAVIDRTQIPTEEAALDSRFGRSYRRYRSRTPRWIGLPAV
ncbi:methyltransferase family protein [Microbacterium gorillae]|uniref:methyltransferase family protein n=1 Tax=Microbacterium gorillae TaxID=1231063 RepID=UPI00059148DD|nr:methyltransferase [Microbacterium gorillae]